jgi:phage baseplate assembly protein W
MGSLSIDSLKKIQPHATVADPSPTVSPIDDYTFKDIKLDLSIGRVVGNFPADRSPNNTDLTDIRDIHAIRQSIINILSTTPGQKLLNPYLGLDLRKFVFDPITEQTGDLIARAILNGLGAQEPRAKIINMLVFGDEDRHVYEITITLAFPGLNVTDYHMSGTLSTSKFNID